MWSYFQSTTWRLRDLKFRGKLKSKIYFIVANVYVISEIVEMNEISWKK
jgi:hypothetical protein